MHLRLSINVGAFFDNILNQVRIAPTHSTVKHLCCIDLQNQDY